MQIRFRGAQVRYYDTRKDDGGAYTRIYFSARADQEVRKKMKWGITQDDKDRDVICDPWPAEGEKSGKLSGTLSATSFILTPKDAELGKHEIEVECSKVYDFSFSVEYDSDGNRKGLLIQFVVRSTAKESSVKIDRYFRNIQDALGELKVDYEKQDKLDLGANEEATEE